VIILDTDHLVTLKHENDPHWKTLTTKLASSIDHDFATTAITVEEQNRGWLALINRYTDVHKQIGAARLSFGDPIRSPLNSRNFGRRNCGQGRGGSVWQLSMAPWMGRM